METIGQKIGHSVGARIGALLNYPEFRITINTTLSGSASDTFVLPTVGGGYDAVVEWGDDTEQSITGTPGNVTHQYSVSGIYKIKISGTFPAIYFNNGGDKLKLISIDNWGDITWSTMSGAFRGCANMVANYYDAPNLANCTITSHMFNGCTLFNGRLNNWNMSTIVNPGAMFYNCSSLNNPVSNWNTVSMTTMAYLFYGCTSFKQSLAGFNISSVTDATSMLSNVDINLAGTTANYDETLKSFSGQVVQQGVIFNGGNSKYSQGAATSARLVLTSSPNNWTISDGGQVSSVASEYDVFYSNFDADSITAINNAVIMPSGIIYAAKESDIVEIDTFGNESIVLSISGTVEWKRMFRAADNSVYVSPHHNCAVEDRGIYKKSVSDASFRKVLSLYDGETNNDDTIWTFTQDNSGNLYAGVYAHSIRNNPVLYKSIDNGENWSIVFDFSTYNINTDHIHCVYNCPHNDYLYVAVGDAGSTVYRSIDGGSNWTDINAGSMEQITAIVSDANYRYFITDKPYMCKIYRTSDDTNFTLVYDGWYLDGFALRVSDVTGWIYAFNVIDGAVSLEDYFPPIEAVTDDVALNTWKAIPPANLVYWQEYYDRLVLTYPQNAIRPIEVTVLVSKDAGDTWTELINVSGDYNEGFKTTGNFMNGKLITGYYGRDNGTLKQLPSILIEERK